MNISHITTLPQIEAFLKNTEQFEFNTESKATVYAWLDHLLAQLKYRQLAKKEKGMVKTFVKRVTSYSKVQIKRLIAKHRKGKLHWTTWQTGERHRVYLPEDIVLLHEVDRIHQLAGPATKKILQREYEVFGKEAFRKLANISPSHIANLRKTYHYTRLGRTFIKTKPRTVCIGTRRKPEPDGRPGFLRVDTVHQGDLGKEKSVYYINAIDEVLQYEFVFCVPSITKTHLIPVLRTLIELCPFNIINFHSDNGSEYINHYVATLLNEIHAEQTKSRPRRSNDNALVESKNGSIIRKEFGYYYIPATKHNVQLLNTFCIQWLTPYLNFHRPCAYATTFTDHKGKEKKVYKTDDYQTPYEKLKSLPHSKQYLKPGISFEMLDKIAYAHSDTEFALEMRNEKDTMLKQLKLKKL